MAKIQEPQRFTIPHPRLKEVKVHCIELEPIEAMDMFASFQKYQKVVAVMNTEGGFVKNDDGTIATQTLTNLPADAMMEILEKNLEGWEGIENDKGAIPFKRENIKVLFNRAFNIPKVTQEKKDGKEVDKTISQSFGDYIQEKINERIDKTMTDLGEELGSPKSKG